MDIQKEQNSFKKTMLDQHGEYDEDHFEIDSYGNFSWIGTDDHFEIWMLCAKAKQAEIDELKGRLAKAQAVPEGFVLIKDDTKTVVAIERMVEQQVEASGMDSRRLERLDGWKIIEAAVKAQEPK